MVRTLATFKMPAESVPHDRTLMAWPTLYSVDGHEDILSGSRREVATIANTISQFEPVTLFASKKDLFPVKRLVSGNVSVEPLSVDYLWMRDTGPVYVQSSHGNIAGINFNFNEWGNKRYPSRSMDWTTAHRILQQNNTQEVKTDISTEGGTIETDGDGTLIATESAILNDNRNAGLSKGHIETTLSKTLGIEKFIWVRGVKAQDIADGHIDAHVRFARPGVVLLSRPATGKPKAWIDAYHEMRTVLQEATDARGRRLMVHDVDEPANIDWAKFALTENTPALNYVNYLVVNNGVIMPRFGDEAADESAKAIVQDLYPEREVVQLFLYWLPLSGGGIHCATQQVPRLVFTASESR